MKISNSKKRLFTRQFWRTIELKYYLLFLIAVFFTFSAIGFVSDLLNNLHYSYPQLIMAVIATGLLSTGLAYAATRNLPLLFLFLAIQLVYTIYLRPEGMQEFTPQELDTKFTIVAAGILFSITAGYAFFVIFITRVGINHFLMKAEMNLAKSIHEVLVPDIKSQHKGFDIYGKSIPASEVGGDLIDVVDNENQLFCMIADVSGHGVSSGVYTGMFKSSLRTILHSESELNKILRNINKSLVPLMKSNMFITSAMMKFNNSDTAEFCVAGHLPILHYRKETKKFDELIIKQIPVGFKSDFEFTSGKVDYKKGDIFLLITDGITETSNKMSSEFGIEGVKKIVKENSGKSSQQISEMIFSDVKSFGDQKDDVTLLVIKC